MRNLQRVIGGIALIVVFFLDFAFADNAKWFSKWPAKTLEEMQLTRP